MYPAFLFCRDLNLHDPKVLLKYLELSAVTRLYQSRTTAGPGPPTHTRDGPCFSTVISGKGAERRRGGLTCLEWDFGSGGLKKESGSFLILMGTEGGTMVLLGFMTALKSASRSVSESPRTWTIWCPAGGLCWLGSIVPTKQNKTKKTFQKKLQSRSKNKVQSNPQTFCLFFLTQSAEQEISNQLNVSRVILESTNSRLIWFSAKVC